MSDLPVYLLAGAVAAVSLLFILGIQYSLARARERRAKRLGLTEDSGVLIHGAQLVGEEKSRLDDNFEKMVARTGLDVHPEQILGLMALLGVVLAGALYLWRGQIPLAVLGLVLGMLGPLVVVYLLKGRYQAQIQEQLPDALYLLARALRAGQSIPQGIEMLGEAGPKPLANEFKRASASIELGLSVPAALQIVAERVQLLDFDSFVSTVAYHSTSGGNLPLLLDRLAASARDRNQFRGQFWAATAQGRITAIALACAAPLLVLGYFLWQPDHVQGFLTSARGWAILGGVAILEIIGVIWVYRILKIDY